MDLEELKKELIHEIQATDDGEILARVRDVLCGTEAASVREAPLAYGTAKELKPYTMEEIRSWLREAEEERAAGIPGKPWRTLMKEAKEKFPWLELSIL